MPNFIGSNNGFNGINTKVIQWSQVNQSIKEQVSALLTDSNIWEVLNSLFKLMI